MILGTYSTPNRILAPKKEIPCKTTYLLKENFLSEYMTNSEKEKVLKNLGILGEDISFNTSWGQILGDITNQKDLYSTFIEIGDDATKMSYSNSNYPNVTNVKQALDTLASLINSDTPKWNYTLYCTPSTVYYGTEAKVTYTYAINSITPDLKVVFDGITTDKTAGSVTKTLRTPVSVVLQASSSTLGELNKSISPTFEYKYFYYLSQDDTYDIENLKEFKSGDTIDCGSEECYIYCIVRKDSVIIKDPNFGLEDSGAFTKQSDLILPLNTFDNQIESIDGYKVLKSINKLTGKWTIKL